MLGQVRLLYHVREFSVSPGRAPLCSSSSVHLFRVDLNVVCVRTLVDLIVKGGPNLLVPSGLLNQTNHVPLVLFVMDFRFGFDALDCDGS